MNDNLNQSPPNSSPQQEETVTKRQAALEIYRAERKAQFIIVGGFLATVANTMFEDFTYKAAVVVGLSAIFGFVYINLERHMKYLNEKYTLGQKSFTLKFEKDKPQ